MKMALFDRPRLFDFLPGLFLSVTAMASGVTPGAAAAMDVTTSQTMEGFQVEGYTDGGQRSWDLKGESADIQTEQVTISNVDANHYNGQTVNLKARIGVLNRKTGDVLLKDDVVITAQEGTRLMTETLQWKKNENKVQTDDHVRIEDRSLTAEGEGLEASPELKTAVMKKDVMVRVEQTTDNPKTPSQQPQVITITCDGPMEIDQANNKAVFHENVKAVQGDRTLMADVMEIHFDPQTKTIEQAVCIGHVIIRQGGNETHSQRAVYDAKAQKITLYGRPKLILETENDGGLFQP